MGQNTLEAFWIHYQPDQTHSSITLQYSDLLGSVIASDLFILCSLRFMKTGYHNI